MRYQTVLLLLALLFTCYRLGVIENERYAMSLGYCLGDKPPIMPDLDCIAQKQPRSPWVWNVYYGLVSG